MHDEDLHFLRPSRALNVFRLDALDRADPVLEAQEYTIKDAPRFDMLYPRLITLETRLRKQRLTPCTIVCGTDMYLVLLYRLDEFLTDHGRFPAPVVDSVLTFRGMELRCDPYLDPMALRILPTAKECSWNAALITEINDAP